MAGSMREAYAGGLPSRPTWRFWLAFVLGALDWAVWLAWDTQYTVTATDRAGPYEAWQVIGLVVVAIVVTSVFILGREPLMSAGFPTGLTVGSFVAWLITAEDGLFVLGVMLIAFGAFACWAALLALLAPLRPMARRVRRQTDNRSERHA